MEKEPSLHGACVSAKHANPAGHVIVQEVDPGTEYVPAEQAVQVEALAAAKVPAAHTVATPYPHLEPAGQERQLEDAATEYVPAAQKEANPFTQDNPAGQGLQVEAPASEYDPARQVTQLLAPAAEKVPVGHCTIVGESLQYHETS